MKTSEYPNPSFQEGGSHEKPPCLHSRYNPQAEAARYADAAVRLPNPVFIVVTEPGEAFLAEALRKKWPNALLCAVRYQNDFFTESDALWDYVWRPNSGASIETFLLSTIPDEAMPASTFISWKASDTFWPDAAKAAWEAIRRFIHIQQSVIATRSAFGQRWLKNCARNIAKTELPALLLEIASPSLIVASGPRIEHFPASFFKEIKSHFFVCALSSASMFLAARGAHPDVIVSTDGGYWAGRLFTKVFADVPVMFPLEAYIPNFALERGKCVFLSYGGALESELFSLCRLSPHSAKRNGTVAGTAADFFLRHTQGNVYAAGLDLESGKAFQHARPHPSSPEKGGSFYRLDPLENQAARTAFSSSLPVYRSWFENMKEEQARRFFRIESRKGELSQLGNIKTLTLSDIETAIPPKRISGKRQQKALLKPSSPLSRVERARAVREWLLSEAERIALFKALGETESEVIKMYSYQSFLSFAKMTALGDEARAAELLSSLKEGARKFLLALAEKLK